MNENTAWFPFYETPPDANPQSASPSTLQWQSLPGYDPTSPQGEHHQPSDRFPYMDPQYNYSVPEDFWLERHEDYLQDAPKASSREQVLSPLLLGLQPLYPDSVVPPTSPLPESFLPPDPSPHHAHPSLTLTPAQTVSPTSPSYLPAPAQPYHQHGLFPPALTSPLRQSFPLIDAMSPGGASVSAYSSPGMASTYYSLSPSPAMSTSTVYHTPMLAGPSTLPGGQSLLLPPTALRIPVKQTIRSTSERAATDKVTFDVGGESGVLVSDVLKDRVVLDRHDDRVLEQTGARQIRLVVALRGYAHAGTYIWAKKSDGRMITRGELAKEICAHIRKVLGGIAKKHTKPGQTKPKISNPDHPLWLVSVAPAQKNIWLAELETSP